MKSKKSEAALGSFLDLNHPYFQYHQKPIKRRQLGDGFIIFTENGPKLVNLDLGKIKQCPEKLDK